MPDSTFQSITPPLKAVDNGDGTFAQAVVVTVVAGTGTDTVFAGMIPLLKAVDNGDGTYSVAVVPI